MGTLTHFPNGVSSFGAPILPSPGLVPSTTSGQGQTPGGVYFVNGDIGNDGYSGTNPTRPFLTLDRAYNACFGGRNEIIYVLGGSAAITFSSAIASGGAGLVWAKNYTHLIGLSAPNMIGQRARITNGTTTRLFTPMIQVSGNGCLFQNVELFNGGADATAAAVCLLVTGQRFCAINCQISGGGNATNAGNAAMRSLVIGVSTPASSDENYFGHCYIGLDTEARTSTSSEVEILGGSARNVFEDCAFSTYATGSGSGAFYVKVGASGIDRFLMFKGCQFLNAGTLSGGVALTDAMSISATPGGQVVFTQCVVTGATGLSASDAAIFTGDAIASVSGSKAIGATW